MVDKPTLQARSAAAKPEMMSGGAQSPLAMARIAAETSGISAGTPASD